MANCNKRETVKNGSDFRLKIAVTNLGDGVKLSQVGISGTLVSGGAEGYTFSGSDLEYIDDNTAILCVANRTAALLGKGDLYMQLQLSIPDEDFPDGLRYENTETDTGITII